MCLKLTFQNDKDKSNYEKIIEGIKNSKKGKCIGIFPKENYKGEFCEGWKAALKKHDFENVDISTSNVHSIYYTLLDLKI